MYIGYLFLFNVNSFVLELFRVPYGYLDSLSGTCHIKAFNWIDRKEVSVVSAGGV